MIIYAVYIITNDERTLLSQNFQSVETISDEQLLRGLFTALQDVGNEVTERSTELKSIEIGGISYHVRSFGPVRIVLVTDVPKSPQDIIQMLGLRFIKEYGEVLSESHHNSNIFAPFKKIISEIITDETISDESKFLKPTKVLDTGAIFNLPHHLQSIALTMISLKEGTIEEIAQEKGEDIDNTLSNITALQEMGYIGTKQKKEKTIYFRAT